MEATKQKYYLVPGNFHLFLIDEFENYPEWELIPYENGQNEEMAFT